jgi:hypothetical protein
MNQYHHVSLLVKSDIFIVRYKFASLTHQHSIKTEIVHNEKLVEIIQYVHLHSSYIV